MMEWSSPTAGFGLMALGCYLIGLLLWFPSVSVLNIGGGSSVQPVVVMGVAVIALMLYAGIGGISRRVLCWFGCLILLLLFQVSFVILTSSEISLYLKGTTFFLLSILMILVGYLVAKREEFASAFFSGYIAGGIFSSAWSVSQYYAWHYLNKDLPLLVGVHNTASFAKYATDAPYVDLGRGFAFTPEPSILFVLLAPCLALMLYFRRSAFILLVVITGIVSTASVGIVLVLPFSLLYFLYVSGRIGRKAALLLIAFSVAGLALFLAVAVNNINSENVIKGSDLSTRVVNIASTASFISRANSFVVAFEMFQQRPLFGWGVQSEEIIANLLSRSTAVEENKGINSLLMSMLVWFGGLFTIVCLTPSLRLIFLEAESSVPVKLFVVITLFGAFMSISYFNLYNIWIAIGMAAPSLDSRRLPLRRSRSALIPAWKESA